MLICTWIDGHLNLHASLGIGECRRLQKGLVLLGVGAKADLLALLTSSGSHCRVGTGAEGGNLLKRLLNKGRYLLHLNAVKVPLGVGHVATNNLV